MGISIGTSSLEALIGAGTSVYGAVTSAAGSYYGAATQKASLQSQADIAQLNAELAEMNAQQRLQRGNREAAQVTMRAGAIKGKQRATLAANGVQMNAGSAAEAQAQTEILKNADYQTVMLNAQREAFGHRISRYSYEADAKVKRAAANAINPRMAAATSLLGSASKIAPMWVKLGLFKDQNKGDGTDSSVTVKGDDSAIFTGYSLSHWGSDTPFVDSVADSFPVDMDMAYSPVAEAFPRHMDTVKRRKL